MKTPSATVTKNTAANYEMYVKCTSDEFSPTEAQNKQKDTQEHNCRIHFHMLFPPASFLQQKYSQKNVTYLCSTYLKCIVCYKITKIIIFIIVIFKFVAAQYTREVFEVFKTRGKYAAFTATA